MKTWIYLPFPLPWLLWQETTRESSFIKRCKIALHQQQTSEIWLVETAVQVMKQYMVVRWTVQPLLSKPIPAFYPLQSFSCQQTKWKRYVAVYFWHWNLCKCTLRACLGIKVTMAYFVLFLSERTNNSPEMTCLWGFWRATPPGRLMLRLFVVSCMSKVEHLDLASLWLATWCCSQRL